MAPYSRGALFDTWQVLDSELRVRGVGALRVVDASAMPSIIGGQVTAHNLCSECPLGADRGLPSWPCQHTRTHNHSTLTHASLPHAPTHHLSIICFICWQTAAPTVMLAEKAADAILSGRTARGASAGAVAAAV